MRRNTKQLMTGLRGVRSKMLPNISRKKLADIYRTQKARSYPSAGKHGKKNQRTLVKRGLHKLL